MYHSFFLGQNVYMQNTIDRQHQRKKGTEIAKEITIAAFSKPSTTGSSLNPPAAVKATSPVAPSKTLHWT